MIDSQIWLFVSIAVLLAVTPGADRTLVMRNTLAGGRAAAWQTILWASKPASAASWRTSPEG